MLTRFPKLHTGVNKVIQFLIYSDLLIQTGWGLISPIIAVFITDQIEGGTVGVVGLAATLSLVSQSIVQLPVAKWIDERKGEKDDLIAVLVGGVIVTVAILAYIYARTPAHIYIIQTIEGIGSGIVYPGYVAIFTRHIDKSREGMEWTLYSTTVNIGYGLAAAIGGFIAEFFGFQYLFISVAVLHVVGNILLLGIRANLRNK